MSIHSLAGDPSWGYDYYATLRLLEASGVAVKRLHYNHSSRGKGVRYVDKDDALLAAAKWEATRKVELTERQGKESVYEAAVRLKIRTSNLRKWLTLEGVLPPPSKKSPTPFFAEPDFFNQLYARHQRRR